MLRRGGGVLAPRIGNIVADGKPVFCAVRAFTDAAEDVHAHSRLQQEVKFRRPSSKV